MATIGSRHVQWMKQPWMGFPHSICTASSIPGIIQEMAVRFALFRKSCTRGCLYLRVTPRWIRKSPPGAYGSSMGLTTLDCHYLPPIGVLVTTIITCVWSGVMGDVQGATGIGQYLLALVTVMSAATLWNLHFTY